MREDVDGSGDHPILQDETGLTRGTSVRDPKKVIKFKNVPKTFVMNFLVPN